MNFTKAFHSTNYPTAACLPGKIATTKSLLRGAARSFRGRASCTHYHGPLPTAWWLATRCGGRAPCLLPSYDREALAAPALDPIDAGGLKKQTARCSFARSSSQGPECARIARTAYFGGYRPRRRRRSCCRGHSSAGGL